MNKELNKALGNMSDLDYRNLELRMQFARALRNLPHEHPRLADNKLLAQELGITVKKLRLIRNCAVNLDMHFIALLHAKRNEWDLEKISKENDLLRIKQD